MPWADIGSVDTGNMPKDEEWILFCLKIAKSYIEYVCGVDEHAKIEIKYHDEGWGKYPGLGIWYDLEEPLEYARKCENALDTLNENIMWSHLKQHAENPIEHYVSEGLL